MKGEYDLGITISYKKVMKWIQINDYLLDITECYRIQKCRADEMRFYMRSGIYVMEHFDTEEKRDKCFEWIKKVLER